MKLNHDDTGKSQVIVTGTKQVIPIHNLENRNYLYPDGHRMTHQMRWLKGSIESGLESDIAA